MTARDVRSYPPAVPFPQLLTAQIAFVLGAVGLMIAARITVSHDPDSIDGFLVGMLAAVVFVALRKHPYRIAGWIPYASLAWFLVAICELLWNPLASFPHAFFGWVIIAASARFLGTYFRIGIVYVLAMVGLLLVAKVLVSDSLEGFRYFLHILAILTGLLTLVTWLLLPRALIETSLEFLLAPRYKVRGAGPGIAAFPMRGPVLLICNHAAYLDPLFLAKNTPRPLTAMMTANFFDKPIIRQLMVYIYDTIRVQEVAVRKDAPELQQAVDALDAGRCVVIFPEGYLRRTEEVPLRRFGRGVWHILRDRPDTPVVACWVEGGWGSYFSFKDGPPTRNKKSEWRRLIRLGYSTPITVPPEILADHLQTRLYLMKRVNEARAHLGLELLPETSAMRPDPAEAPDLSVPKNQEPEGETKGSS